MKVSCNFGLAVIAVVVLSACSTAPISGSDQSHVHSGPAISIGERYHAAMEYNPDWGKITIIFYNDDDRSVGLFSGHSVKGEIEFGGARKSISFVKAPKPGRFVPTDYSTNRIEANGEWLRNISNFALKVQVPIRGTVHELSFVYSEEA